MSNSKHPAGCFEAKIVVCGAQVKKTIDLFFVSKAF
jgi:hypothetical protein